MYSAKYDSAVLTKLLNKKTCDIKCELSLCFLNVFAGLVIKKIEA